MWSRELEKTQGDVSENLLSQSLCSYEWAKKQSACCLLGLLLDPAGGVSMSLRNVGTLQPHYTGNIHVRFEVLFIYCLFNDSLSSTGYIVSNVGMVTKGWLVKKLIGPSSEFFQDTIVASAWSDWVKSQRNLFQNSRCLDRDSNRDPLKPGQKHYHVSQLVVFAAAFKAGE
jgi:hypothetical protein